MKKKPARHRRETVFEKSQRIRLQKMRRVLAKMRRVSEPEKLGFLDAAGEAIDAYDRALEDIRQSQITMQTIFSHLTRIIETSDRPKREAKKVRLLVAQLDLAFEDTEAMARQTFDLNWEILMSLLKIFEKHP